VYFYSLRIYESKISSTIHVLEISVYVGICWEQSKVHWKHGFQLACFETSGNCVFQNILKSTIEKEARIHLTYENNTLFFYRPL